MAETSKFDHVGGHPLIDFVNTKFAPGGQLIDLLQTNADVIAWLVDVGLTTEKAIQFNWQDDTTLLTDVRTFRQQMRNMLINIVSEDPIDEAAIAAINKWLQFWQAKPKLVQFEDKFEVPLDFVLTQSEQILARFADIAAHFLAEVDLRYVKRCNNHECIRIFLDTSKNHSRRWCSMEGCGNRMKARAHYARKR